jgi:uncharacterized phage-associated protein
MTTAMQVARYLDSERFVFGEMQLQKLLYYSQAWSLAWTGSPLFSDEIEAWRGGPVVRTVWASRRHGTWSFTDAQDAELSDDERAVVDAVYAFYGDNGGHALSVLTHAEVPWQEARDGLPPTASSTAPVSQATMRRFYTRASLNGGGQVPKPPVRKAPAPASAVHIAGQRQSARWRTALDALALQ